MSVSVSEFPTDRSRFRSSKESCVLCVSAARSSRTYYLECRRVRFSRGTRFFRVTSRSINPRYWIWVFAFVVKRVHLVFLFSISTFTYILMAKSYKRVQVLRTSRISRWGGWHRESRALSKVDITLARGNIISFLSRLRE